MTPRPASSSSLDVSPNTPRARATCTVELLLNGVRVPVEFDDVALDALAAAQPTLTPTAWPEWLSVETAARYLDVTAERVRKLKERDQIPHYQDGPGRRVFFRRSELDEWMQTFRVEQRGGQA